MCVCVCEGGGGGGGGSRHTQRKQITACVLLYTYNGSCYIKGVVLCITEYIVGDLYIYLLQVTWPTTNQSSGIVSPDRSINNLLHTLYLLHTFLFIAHLSVVHLSCL